jgi:phage shock protein PspC (stress-responsive transcriptional regulator)
MEPSANLPPTPPLRPQLRRSRSRRLIFGVCAGIAEYFGKDTTLVRAGTVLLALFPPASVPVIAAYVLLAAILPQEGDEHLSPIEHVQRNVSSMREDVMHFVDGVRSSMGFGRKSETHAPLGSSFSTDPLHTDRPGGSQASDLESKTPDLPKAA